MDGVLIINKPAGMTSHDVVAHVRRITGEKSVGHLGTLDPMATGVLPLVLGRFTRLAQFYNEAEKRYAGTIRFGWATDTYDAQGQPTGPEQPVTFTAEALREAAKQFTGTVEQLPPPFSAKKIAGIPAYRLARKGQPVELKAKQVEIKELDILSWDGIHAEFKAWVSSGTYLRSLAQDLGQKLGPGAHLAGLQRTAVREFTIDEAHSLDELEQAVATNTLSELFLHPRLILPEFPAVTAPPESAARIRHGGAVNLPEFSKASVIRVFAGQRELLAIARRVAGTLFQPKVVLQG
ncbi:MAG TPA: tRNA pseudouridine(55) synthase TruB [Candidatus Sulfotelmatobacter sp.]|nr:tRNA pseudouridine(55) synthase TruB [Candidatus Sulfotelmatobacter sp.]